MSGLDYTLHVIRAAGRDVARALGARITYERGSHRFGVNATPGSSTHPVTDAYGVTTEIHAEDWIIDAAELVIDAEQIEPQRGDLIKVIETNRRTVTYTVLPPAENMDEWEWEGPPGGLYRIHTKRTA